MVILTRKSADFPIQTEEEIVLKYYFVCELSTNYSNF